MNKNADEIVNYSDKRHIFTVISCFFSHNSKNENKNIQKGNIISLNTCIFVADYSTDLAKSKLDESDEIVFIVFDT